VFVEVALDCESVPRASFTTLVREPLLWAALATFVGTAVGLVGTLRYAGLMTSDSFSLFGMLSATAAQFSGEALAALSLLGVPALLGGAFRKVVLRAAVVGGVLISVFIVASATAFFYLWHMNTGAASGTTAPFPRVAKVCFWVSVFAPPAVVLPFAVAALWASRVRLRALLGLLCVLCFPLGVPWVLLHPEGSTTLKTIGIFWLLGLLGTGVGLPQAPLWVLLGVMLLRGARRCSLRKAERLEAEENRKKALRLYEEGLGRCDLCVIDELISEDFRDLRGGSRGRLGMERLITDL
jgi:hypothetical protein